MSKFEETVLTTLEKLTTNVETLHTGQQEIRQELKKASEERTANTKIINDVLEHFAPMIEEHEKRIAKLEQAQLN